MFCADVAEHSTRIPDEYKGKCYPKDSTDCINPAFIDHFAFMADFDRHDHFYSRHSGKTIVLSIVYE